jgi:gamma-glutamylcyclotransferase (GGCT)/AIG2-like uncharacterized protein YtfP
MTLFAIYGTFMRGQPGHGNLAGARFLEDVRTEPRYRLWLVDSLWPALVPDEDGVEIACELYDVPDDLLAELARIEPPGWNRAPVELVGGRVAEAFLGVSELRRRGVDVSECASWSAFVASAQPAART